MNKFLANKLPSSLRETVNSTVSGLSENAARLKQNWDTAARPPEEASPSHAVAEKPAAAKAQQFLRLPVESARKLRWYDREDLNQLIETTLKEKQQLNDTIAALKQALQHRGVDERDVSLELEERLADADKLRYYDEGVSSVLLASAQGEIESLRGEVARQARDLEQLQKRLHDSEGASTSDSGAYESMHTADDAAVHPDDSALQVPRAHQSLLPAFEAAGGSNRAAAQPSLPPERLQQLVEALQSFEASSSAAELAARRSMLEQESLLAALQRTAAAASPQLPVSTAASTSGQQEAETGDAAESSAEAQAVTSDTGPGAAEELDLLKERLAVETQSRAALLGKLERVEVERQRQFEEVSSLQDQVGSLQARLTAAESDRKALEETLEKTRQELTEMEQTAERRLQELRGKVGSTQDRHVELLRKAQDICLGAEARAEATERKLEKAEARCAKAEADLQESRAEARRLGQDLKAREKDRDKAEARAASAEAALEDAHKTHSAELERGSAANSVLAGVRKAADEREAELRKAMREGEAKLRERISHLDDDNSDLRRSIAKARGEVASMERRVKQAEDGEALLMHDLRQAEALAADRDELAARVGALEEKLRETRAESGKLQNYKQLVRELEDARMRLENEVVTTVKIATSLESRLQAAKADVESAQHAALAADRRATEAERKVEREVEHRLEAIGENRVLWPHAARDEVSRLEKKLQAVHGMLASLQQELEDESQRRDSDAAALAGLQVRLAAAEERASRLEWEAREATGALQRQVAAARAEADEMRREAALAEEARLKAIPVMTKQGSLSLSRQQSRASLNGGGYTGQLHGGGNGLRRGGGSLHGVADMLFDAYNNTNGDAAHSELMNSTDILYMKNVILKFVEAHAAGRIQERDVLLPAIATLLRATPQEFRTLKAAVDGSNSWWPRIP
ncbi:hypothetical protein WJX72_011792 [[Myrmecia] bisecta]|uniref:GRIP domain-containing protein n=1 Tax=[Myrmecia] bisecta TaxID=41462 RepID=A0AAW1Q6M2_9CHLO